MGTTDDACVWLNIEDPCGLICAAVVIGLFLYASVAVSILLRPWPAAACATFYRVSSIAIFDALVALALTAHVRTMLTDPGAVPLDARLPATSFSGEATESGSDDDDIEAVLHEQQGSPMTTSLLMAELKLQQERAAQQQDAAAGWCHRCDRFKPRRAHHCSVCRRCVVKMDHHCPWVNNCVGVGNHKLFMLFLTYTLVVCIYYLCLVGLYFGAGLGVPRESAYPGSAKGACMPAKGGHLVVAIVAGVAGLFGVFVAIMMVDQVSALRSNLTKIDRLKGQWGAASEESVVGVLREVFGGSESLERGGCAPVRMHWLVPRPAAFPMYLRSHIFGYSSATQREQRRRQREERRARRCCPGGRRPGEAHADLKCEVVPAFDAGDDLHAVYRVAPPPTPRIKSKVPHPPGGAQSECDCPKAVSVLGTAGVELASMTASRGASKPE